LEEFEERVTGQLYRPFAIAGRHCYLIGYQNGAFPDIGQHLPGEMGGLWVPPLKLADGFWFGLRANSAASRSNVEWLYDANCRGFSLTPGKAQRDFELTLNGSEITARQELFVPENEPGLLITLSLSNRSETDQDLTLSWLVRFDLQGAWWSNWPDRPDEAHFEPSSGAILANDSLHTEWSAGMLGDRTPGHFDFGPDLWAAERTGSLQGHLIERGREMLRNPAELQGHGVSGQLDYPVHLKAGQTETLYFAIAGGAAGAGATGQLLAYLLERREDLWAAKEDQLKELLAHAASIKTPFPALERAFAHSNLCLDLLTLDLPELGPGIVAGLPEFAWYFGCDTYYCASGLLISGQAGTALETLRLLSRFARQQGGRVPHEITQANQIFNPGNTIEAGEFVTAVERAYRWTGDRAFLDEMYEVCRAAIFDYMLGECDPDGTLLPDGAGLLELRTAEHGKKLDVACNLFQGLNSLAYLAQVVGDSSTAERSLQLAAEVRTRINRYFWVEARQEYVWRIEPDLSVHPDEPAHSYVALETGLLRESETDRINRLFERVEGPEHTGPRGLIHPGTADFVMPIQNAIIAQAEFRYNRPNQGLWYLERMAELDGHYMPWAIPEFVGENACFIQAWSSAAYNWLIVQGFFRLNPDPVTGVVLVQPQLPDGWDVLEANNLTLWQGSYDLRLERFSGGLNFSYIERTAGAIKPHFEVVARPGLPVTFI
jgi:hypothetical protein